MIELVPRSPSDKYVPSADRMMVSVAEACGPATLGVVLTGMGKDGVEGVIAIKSKRGQCLAESEESAVVFGMPQEAIRTGARGQGAAARQDGRGDRCAVQPPNGPRYERSLS